MTAQEMFELIGYKKTRTTSFIEYSIQNVEEMNIKFDFERKRVCIGAYAISIYEHKAIHQQMKELGWLDEE